MFRQVICASAALLLVVGFAWSQDSNKVAGVVKLVDADKGKMLVVVPAAGGGTKVVEYDIGKNVKFLDEKGKPMVDKDGKPIKGTDILRSEVFKSDKNRPQVPISISFKDGNVSSIKLTPKN